MDDYDFEPIPPSRWDNLPYIIAGVLLVAVLFLLGNATLAVIRAVADLLK